MSFSTRRRAHTTPPSATRPYCLVPPRSPPGPPPPAAVWFKDRRPWLFLKRTHTTLRHTAQLGPYSPRLFICPLGSKVVVIRSPPWGAVKAAATSFGGALKAVKGTSGEGRQAALSNVKTSGNYLVSTVKSLKTSVAVPVEKVTVPAP